jgi:hypothetical protein
MLLCELLLRSQQLRLQRLATLSLPLQLPGQVTDLARMLLAQLLCLGALLRQLSLQIATCTLLLFKRLLQIQQGGARLDALLLQLILQLLPACQP